MYVVCCNGNSAMTRQTCLALVDTALVDQHADTNKASLHGLYEACRRRPDPSPVAAEETLCAAAFLSHSSRSFRSAAASVDGWVAITVFFTPFAQSSGYILGHDVIAGEPTSAVHHRMAGSASTTFVLVSILHRGRSRCLLRAALSRLPVFSRRLEIALTLQPVRFLWLQ